MVMDLDNGVRRSTDQGLWGLMRMVVALLLGVVISGLGSYVVFVSHSVTRADVSEMIQNQDPYVLDRSQIRAQLIEQSAQLQALNNQVQVLNVRLARIETVIERCCFTQAAKKGP